jgi:hypothetical protein
VLAPVGAFGYPMTTAVIIGYVSLFAAAIQTGSIMIEFIREALGDAIAGPATSQWEGPGTRTYPFLGELRNSAPAASAPLSPRGEPLVTPLDVE